jgi:hypothetical protein
MYCPRTAIAPVFALALAAACAGGWVGGCDRGDGPEPAQHAGEPEPATPQETPPQNPTPTPTGAADAGDASTGAPTARPTPPSDGPDLSSIIAARSAQRSLRPLDIEHFLSRGDVRELTNFAGALTEVPLEGQTADAEYNGFRFAGDNHLGVTVQAWDMSSSAAANRLYERLRQTYLASEASRADVGDESFRSTHAGVRQFVFLNRRRSMVVAVQVCPGDGELTALASRVFQNM